MARDGAGTYNLPAGQPVVTGTTISSSTHNTLASDLATALTNSIAKNGETTPTANLPMGGYGLTNASVWYGRSTGGVTVASIVSEHQVNGTTTTQARRHTALFSADANAPALVFAKSRHATIGSHTVVQSGDDLGAITAYGSDGTDFEPAAQILFEVDGTPGNNDMPGRIVFLVTPDGSTTLAEAGRISQNKTWSIGTTNPSATTLEVHGRIDLKAFSGADANFYIDAVNDAGDSLQFRNNSRNAANFTIGNSGGITVGAPTGGLKGAGTANFAGDIYKNNTAYTNPDYVLEHWATGKIEKFADKQGAAEYSGLLPLTDVESFARKHWHLPRFGQAAGHGLFSGSDALLAALEEAYLYIFDMEKRLRALEKKAKA